MKLMTNLAALKGPFILAVSVIYIGFLLFALFNYRSHCVFTEPESLIQLKKLEPSKAAQICRVDFDNLDVAKLDIFSEPSMEHILMKYPHVQNGGKWKPTGCISYQKVAIIIPYRDRLHHLKLMLNRIHQLLYRQKIDYRVFVIEQHGRDRFNRGKLMNVGFKEALKVDDFDCFVFHDVDLLPENDKNLYMCDDHLRHLSSAIDETRYHVMYFNYAGGVIAMKAENFRKINGYPNSYWGWGNEDDDISARMQESGLLFTRPPEYIGRFKMVRHVKETRSENGYGAFLGWRGRWKKDGLYAPETMKYNVTKFAELSLYTNITVDIGPSEGHRIDPTKDTTKESIWWFLKFYFP